MVVDAFDDDEALSFLEQILPSFIIALRKKLLKSVMIKAQKLKKIGIRSERNEVIKSNQQQAFLTCRTYLPI